MSDTTAATPAEPAEFQALTDQAIAHISTAMPMEIFCVVSLPVLALLLGLLLNRWIDSRPRLTMGARIVDFIAPLLAPALAVIFLGLAHMLFRADGATTVLLPFALKLAVSWLAIHVVLKISPHNSAGWFILLVIIPVTVLHLLGLWGTVTATLEQISFEVGKLKFNLYLILKTAAAIVALFWISGFLSRMTEQRLRRMQQIHISNRVLIMKFFQIFLYFVVFMVGLQILGIDFTALSIFGGALGVGIGFGLQKIASNFISGIILLFEKSVEIGDQVQLDDGTIGFIRHTGARYTLLELADGREALIPNEDFITQRVFSYTYSGSRGRIDIPLSVDYASDVELAQKLMIEAAKANPRCLPSPAPLVFLSQFGENGIGITLYMWVGDIEQGTVISKGEVMGAILTAFRQAGIEFASPRQVQLKPKEKKA